MAISISASFLLDRVVAFRDYLFRRASRRRRGRVSYAKIGTSATFTPRPIPVVKIVNIEKQTGQKKEKSSSEITRKRAPLNYAILVAFLIAPVCFFAAQSFNNPAVRWFRIVALQDDRMADITEQIASSEIVQDSTDIVNDDTKEDERACGLIAIAAEAVFETLLTLLNDAVAPLLNTLNALRQFSKDLLGQIRIGTLFAPINLNLPVVENSEFWIVFTLPLAVVGVGIAAIGADITLRWTHLRNGKLEFLLESVKGIILALGLAAFQLDLIIYAVFNSLNGLDVPLFDVQVELGDMLVFSLYSSIMCVATGIVLYMYEYLL